MVVDPDPAAKAFSVRPVGIADALSAALADQDAAVTGSLLDRGPGLRDGVYTVVVDLPVPPGGEDGITRDLATIGGDLRWYGAAAGWAARLLLGRLFGERLRLVRPDVVAEGAVVDWWRIARAEPGELVLRSVGWFPGDAWLGYRNAGGMLRQVAAFRPRGIPGFLYWKLLVPVHVVAFARMARHRIRRAAASTTTLAGEQSQASDPTFVARRVERK